MGSYFWQVLIPSKNKLFHKTSCLETVKSTTVLASGSHIVCDRCLLLSCDVVCDVDNPVTCCMSVTLTNNPVTCFMSRKLTLPRVYYDVVYEWTTEKSEEGGCWDGISMNTCSLDQSELAEVQDRYKDFPWFVYEILVLVQIEACLCFWSLHQIRFKLRLCGKCCQDSQETRKVQKNPDKTNSGNLFPLSFKPVFVQVRSEQLLRDKRAF